MSSLPFPKAHIEQLKTFIDLCKKQPELLQHPELAFFKQYILSMGGKIPPPRAAGDSPKKPEPKAAEPEPAEEPAEEEPLEESDIELDNSGVIEPDNDDPQPMGDKDKEISEEDTDKSNDKKREAISAFASSEYEEAVKLYTEAILLNPGSALLYAKRGQAYLSLNKPNACIRDCERALEINPDSAAAYKFRGRAHRLLGHWEEAARDLRQACRIDFDEQADEWLREVTPNALASTDTIVDVLMCTCDKAHWPSLFEKDPKFQKCKNDANCFALLGGIKQVIYYLIMTLICPSFPNTF
ncbi:Hsc70-interacting protein 2 [Gryllus bimaculatus]|nr:Hsc70-interacting protein 2 [Gryllus bimaculatus]